MQGVEHVPPEPQLRDAVLNNQGLLDSLVVDQRLDRPDLLHLARVDRRFFAALLRRRRVFRDMPADNTLLQRLWDFEALLRGSTAQSVQVTEASLRITEPTHFHKQQQQQQQQQQQREREQQQQQHNSADMEEHDSADTEEHDSAVMEEHGSTADMMSSDGSDLDEPAQGDLPGLQWALDNLPRYRWLVDLHLCHLPVTRVVGFPSLRRLVTASCSQLHVLEDLPSLVQLEVHEDHCLASIGCLPALQKLLLQALIRSNTTLTSIRGLSSLTSLEVNAYRELSEVSALPALAHLDAFEVPFPIDTLTGLVNLRMIADEDDMRAICAMTRLTELRLYIQSVVDTLSGVPSLRRLWVNEGTKRICDLPSLEHLVLEYSEGTTIDNLPACTYIAILSGSAKLPTNVPALRSLVLGDHTDPEYRDRPEFGEHDFEGLAAVSGLRVLQCLRVLDCKDLAHIHDLPNLRQLDVRGCSDLRTINLSAPSLQRLHLEGTPATCTVTVLTEDDDAA